MGYVKKNRLWKRSLDSLWLQQNGQFQAKDQSGKTGVVYSSSIVFPGSMVKSYGQIMSPLFD